MYSNKGDLQDKGLIPEGRLGLTGLYPLIRVLRALPLELTITSKAQYRYWSPKPSLKLQQADSVASR